MNGIITYNDSEKMIGGYSSAGKSDISSKIDALKNSLESDVKNRNFNLVKNYESGLITGVKIDNVLVGYNNNNITLNNEPVDETLIPDEIMTVINDIFIKVQEQNKLIQYNQNLLGDAQFDEGVKTTKKWLATELVNALKFSIEKFRNKNQVENVADNKHHDVEISEEDLSSYNTICQEFEAQIAEKLEDRLRFINDDFKSQKAFIEKEDKKEIFAKMAKSVVAALLPVAGDGALAAEDLSGVVEAVNGFEDGIQWSDMNVGIRDNIDLTLENATDVKDTVADLTEAKKNIKHLSKKDQVRVQFSRNLSSIIDEIVPKKKTREDISENEELIIQSIKSFKHANNQKNFCYSDAYKTLEIAKAIQTVSNDKYITDEDLKIFTAELINMKFASSINKDFNSIVKHLKQSLLSIGLHNDKLKEIGIFLETLPSYQSLNKYTLNSNEVINEQLTHDRQVVDGKKRLPSRVALPLLKFVVNLTQVGKVITIPAEGVGNHIVNKIDQKHLTQNLKNQLNLTKNALKKNLSTITSTVVN